MQPRWQRYRGRVYHGLLDQEVVVAVGDRITVFTDKDGDDKPDSASVNLFTGISGTQHDHGIHAVHFGPDGKFYFNFGNTVRQIKDKDGKEQTFPNAQVCPYDESHEGEFIPDDVCQITAFGEAALLLLNARAKAPPAGARPAPPARRAARRSRRRSRPSRAPRPAPAEHERRALGRECRG